MYGRRILPSQNTSQRNLDVTNDTELKVAKFMMYSSVTVLCCKIYFAHRNIFDAWGTKLVSLLSALWQYAVEFNWLLIPFLSGLLVTYVTWILIYCKTKEPGVKPINASKTSGSWWHSCYIAAVANCVIFVTILLFLCQ